MKSTFKNATLPIILCCFMAVHGFAQKCAVAFQADFRGVTVKDPATIGIRGGKAPLAWDKTLPMQDADKDGIYTLTVDFADFKVGEAVEYKYFHSEAGWENDKYGSFGNRSLTLVDGSQSVPVQKYDQLDKFSSEALLRGAEQDNFRDVIFIVAIAKKRGLSLEAIAQEVHDFWKEGDSWPQTPQDWMAGFQIGQAQASQGKFEVLEDKPGQVKFRIVKTFDTHFDQSGTYKGVSKAEINQIWKKLNELTAADKGWKLDWNEGAENVEITVTGQAVEKKK